MAITHETFRNASVARPPQSRQHDQLSAIQWVVVLSEFNCIYIHPNDIFEVDKIFFKNCFQKNQLSIPDSRPK